MNAKNLQQKWARCCEGIGKIVKAKDVDCNLLLDIFLRLVELKSRLERLGKRIDEVAYHGYCRQVTKYKLWELYQWRFGLHLPEEVIACARYVEENLQCFTPENEDSKREQREKVERRCLEMVFGRERLALVYGELRKVWPEHDFRNSSETLRHIDRVWENLYFPPTVCERIYHYIEENCVDIESMSWFLRPGIEEIPILLPCDLEEAEAQAIAESVLNSQEQAPEIVTIPYRPEYRMCADTESIDEKEEKSRKLREAMNAPPLYKDEAIEIRVVSVCGKLWSEIFAHKTGKVSVEFMDTVKTTNPGKSYMKFCIGHAADIQKPFALKVLLNEQIIFYKILRLEADSKD